MVCLCFAREFSKFYFVLQPYCVLIMGRNITNLKNKEIAPHNGALILSLLDRILILQPP